LAKPSRTNHTAERKVLLHDLAESTTRRKVAEVLRMLQLVGLQHPAARRVAKRQVNPF
jgi:hypothetical protein